MTFSVAHFSPHIGSGGLGQSIPKLCSALAARGDTVRLHVIDAPANSTLKGVELFVHAPSAGINPLRNSASLQAAVRTEASERADVLHVHSLWSMASILPGQVARRSSCRLVHSPRGTMAAWAMAHRKWRKKIVWNWMQRKAVANADCICVTSEKELEDVRKLGLKNPAAIIPNGIDLPTIQQRDASATTARRLLFLGRIHPVKALDRLLKSWSILHPRFPDWELVVAGEDDGGTTIELKKLASDLKLPRVSFPGLVRESERDALYQSADLFVLPSHTENFGIAVAEALANEVPAVVSRHAPWNNIEREGCGWWTPTEPEALAECLASAMSQPTEKRRTMGALGRAWMQREFSWSRAAEMTDATYRWLIGGGNVPGWVA